MCIFFKQDLAAGAKCACGDRDQSASADASRPSPLEISDVDLLNLLNPCLGEEAHCDHAAAHEAMASRTTCARCSSDSSAGHPWLSTRTAAQEDQEDMEDLDDDPSHGMLEPWDWLSDSEDEDEETREFLQAFRSELEKSFNMPTVQGRVVDLDLLALGSRPEEDWAASSPTVHPQSPPRNGMNPRSFVRRHLIERTQRATSSLFSSVVMAGAAGRSLRRSARATSSSPTRETPVSGPEQ